MRCDFGAVITAMATPFTPEKEVDLDGVVALAGWLLDHGSDALVLTGTTGESPTLSDDEKFSIWSAVRRSYPNARLIAGATTASTAHSLEGVRKADDLGLDGILAVVPYYNRPSQEGLFRHFSAICGATSLPVILYDIPVRTGRKAASDTIVALIDAHPNLAGLKDAAGNVGATAELIARVGEEFVVYSGDDGLTLPLVAVGARGIVSVASHWAGLFFQAMIDAARSGAYARAAEINAALTDSYRFEAQESAPNPIPLKAMLATLDLPSGGCRLPLEDPDEELLREARGVYAALSEHAAKLPKTMEMN
ncbi:MAG: 4-hydroxy-tetrahydrodipicolinate synthase [Acidimicrobiales bacterium]